MDETNAGTRAVVHSELLAMTSRIFSVFGAPLIVALLLWALHFLAEGHDAITRIETSLQTITGELGDHEDRLRAVEKAVDRNLPP